MANYDLSKVMSLADAQAMYKDLRDRMKEIEVPVEDVMVDGVSVVVNGIANIPAIPTVPVTDVQTNGTSILNNGIANIPIAGANDLGLVKINNQWGITLEQSTGKLYINAAGSSDIKGGINAYKPIVPNTLRESIYFGLSNLAGVYIGDRNNLVLGQYPNDSKQAIQKLFGLDGILGDYESATASKAYAIGETFIYNGKRYRATVAIAQSDVIAPGTNCELDPLDGRYVRNTDYAGSGKHGVVKVDGLGLSVNQSNGELYIYKAQDNHIKAGATSYFPIVPETQHKSIFYGLSKLAGVDLANETVTVGTYPTTAKEAILAMLGANGNGLQILNGTLATNSASTTLIKNASNSYAPIVSSHIHDAAFFGLAKAANADMASLSDVTVGQYPQAQKTAIQTMLGIEADIPLVETITGATVSITGMPNVRYICGTAISELTITPPASGSIVVRFVAGSNCIVSLPQTVKLPEWFDISSLEAGTTYELIITDGVYGGVMSWA